MNKFKLIKKLILPAMLPMLLPGVVGAVDRIGDFSLLDQNGHFHNMSWYDDHVAIALLVHAVDSEATAAALPVFEALKDKYDAAGIEFMMINPMGYLNRDSVRKQVAVINTTIPVLMDDAQVISEALGIDKTGEVFLYDPKSFTVEYRGPGANTELAIQELLAGKEVSIDPLAELSWPESKWAFGEPDVILKIPEQHVPAAGVLDYRYINVAIDLDGQDRWLRGSQYLPGDRTVLHHTVNTLRDPGQVGRRGGPDQANITAYIPGVTPKMAPPNTGGLLKDGSVLRLNMHYTTNGKESIDRGEIGLWFYPEDEVPTERMSGRCACIFTADWTNIPPYDPNFVQTQTITIAEDAYIHSMLPHMHFRGKSMRFVAEYPDGTSEELINIANYNYNWQLTYTYEEPKFVPAGTKITAIGAFDNSAQNPANPDPSRSVPWGQQSWDEMFIHSVPRVSPQNIELTQKD